MVNIAVMLHVMAVVIWVGGMLFAHMMLRPVAASQLEPPARLKLWVGVFGRFFPAVWVSIIVILVTGFWVIGIYGGFKGLPMHINIMMATGIIMMFIFSHVFFAPYKRLKQAVAAEDWPTGGKKLAQIRMLVGINTIIGFLTIAVRYFV
ncbi:MAG: CopD family protein [Gammaproteobacteria bacterium]|nr:CopD family protein [Gammaproteobacteria bacterium]